MHHTAMTPKAMQVRRLRYGVSSISSCIRRLFSTVSHSSGFDETKPKFHYDDFMTKSATSSRQSGA